MIVYDAPESHRCNRPPTHAHNPGSLFRCVECGKLWQLNSRRYWWEANLYLRWKHRKAR